MGILTSCIPRKDVLDGDLRDAIFAADFGEVVAGRSDAAPVYREPALFFQNTHPARDLKRIVQQVFEALAKTNEPGIALRLSTGFGGGKTHTLLSLWHLANNVGDKALGTELLPAKGRPKHVTVVAIDAGKAGHPEFARHGAVGTKSLAGEVAYCLKGANGVKDLGPADSTSAQPTEQALEALFPEGPVLLLLDELVIYLSGLDDQGRKNTLNVVNKLLAIASRRPQTVLVVTDPGAQLTYAGESADLGKVMAAAKSLDELLGRKATDFDPIGSEAARVIARRLFDKVDAKAGAKVAEQYRQLYARVSDEHPNLIPAVARTEEYTKRIEESYPFHPRLLATAKDRLGAMPEFQRSRGVLRLFARVVRDVWTRKEDVDLVTAGEVDFGNPQIKGDLLQRLNRDQFDAAVSADVNGHASELDDHKRAVHTRVASALLLESLPAVSHAGLTPDDLTLAVLRPSEAGAEATEALDHLIGTCWHLYPMDGGAGYHFRYQPNVRKQIEERRNRIPLEDAEARVRAEVQGFFQGIGFKTVNWPADAHAVPDAAQLQLVLCSNVTQAKSATVNSDDRDPSAPMKRRYINAIVGIAPSDAAFKSAVQRAQLLAAAEELQKEHRTGDAGALVRDQLAKLLPDLEKQFRVQTRRAFDRVIIADGSVYTIDESFQGGDDNLLKSPLGQQILRRFLEEKSLIYGATDALAPDLLVSRYLSGATPLQGEKDVWSAEAIHERLLGVQGLRLIPDEELTRRTIIRSVQGGQLIVRTADGTAYDKKGAVAGVPGARKRRADESLSSLAIDEQVHVTLPGSGASALWLAEDAPASAGKSKGGGPAPVPSAVAPAPLGVLVATEISKAIEMAAARPLESLVLKASTPAGAKALSALAQPFGAHRITLGVSAIGPVRGGGRMALTAEGLKINHPLKPIDMAGAIANGLEELEEFTAALTLIFEPGLLLAGDHFKRLDKDAEDVSVEATFGAPSGGKA